MASRQTLDALMRDIYSLDRDCCIRELQAIGRPRLDFTPAYLEALSLDRLRHVLMAASLQARKHRHR